jgi:hypothetical protein
MPASCPAHLTLLISSSINIFKGVQIMAELRVQVVSIPFSGGPACKLGPERGYAELCRDFSVTPRQVPGKGFKLGHNCFLPYPLQFIIN